MFNYDIVYDNYVDNDDDGVHFFVLSSVEFIWRYKRELTEQ